MLPDPCPVAREEAVAGCRGVKGPVPQPLWMSACTPSVAPTSGAAPEIPFGPRPGPSAPVTFRHGPARREARGRKHRVGLPPGTRRGSDDRRHRRGDPGSARRARRTRRRDRRRRRRLPRRTPRAVARAAGARVVAEREILPEAGPGSGKGNALWKSLHECTRRPRLLARRRPPQLRGPSSSTRLLEPLLTQPDICFVKAYYHRSYEGAPTGGGRVTELVARPVLSLALPEARRHRAAARR